MLHRFKYAALGDSTAVGFGAEDGSGYPARLVSRLIATGEKVATLNLAENGATSRDVLEVQVPTLHAKTPDLVTLGVGANDLWRLVAIETFATNLERIAEALEQTGATVIVSNLPDLALAPIASLARSALGIPLDLVRSRLALMNDRIAALTSRPRFHVVDMFRHTAEDLPRHPEYFSPDGFHPSAAGYERWAELLWPSTELALETWRKQRAARAGHEDAS